MKKPLISVIIPAYNMEEYIEGTLKSVLYQTISDFEIIVIDDGSSDYTAKRVTNLKDARVRLYSINQNQGVSHARNVGMQKARGKYFCFLDADDLLRPKALEHFLRTAKKNQTSTVFYAKFDELFEKRLLRPPNTFFPQGNVYDDILRSFCFIGCGSNCFIPAEKALKFDENMSVAEDWDYHIRLAEKYTYACTNSYDVIYRKRNNSAMGDYLSAIKKFKQFLQKPYYAKNKRLQHIVYKDFIRNMAHSCFKRGNLSDPKRFFFGARMWLLYVSLTLHIKRFL